MPKDLYVSNLFDNFSIPPLQKNASSTLTDEKMDILEMSCQAAGLEVAQKRKHEVSMKFLL